MKALRIKITQRNATYSYGNKSYNKDTLPLPMYSMIIGAIHNACGYKEYKEMDISVQGKYSSIKEKRFKTNTILNTIFDDRGTLIWTNSQDVISSSYIKVGEVTEISGCSYLKNENIRILNSELYNLFLSSQKNKEYEKHFRTLLTGIDTIKQLCNVELIIHISSSEKTLDDINNNIYNLTSLGNSENYIELEEIKYVELTDIFDKTYKIQNGYGIYININKVNNGCFINKKQIGTVFDINKNYTIVKSKRVFEKIPCLYTTNAIINENFSKKGLFLDKINEKEYYIVNLN